jgi:hypothetical protein
VTSTPPPPALDSPAGARSPRRLRRGLGVAVGLGLLLAGVEHARTVRARETHERLLVAWGSTRECLLGGPLGPTGTIAARLRSLEAGQPRSSDGALVPAPVAGIASAAPDGGAASSAGADDDGPEGWPLECRRESAQLEPLIERAIWLTVPSTRAAALRRLLQAQTGLQLSLISRRDRLSRGADDPEDETAALTIAVERLVTAANEAGLQAAPVPVSTSGPGAPSPSPADTGATATRRGWLLPRFPFPLPRAVLASGRLHDAVTPPASSAPTTAVWPVTLAAAVAPLAPGPDARILHVQAIRDERPFRRGTTVWLWITPRPVDAAGSGPTNAPTPTLLLVDDAHGGTTISDVALVPIPEAPVDAGGRRLVLYRADGGVSLIDFDASASARLQLHD